MSFSKEDEVRVIKLLSMLTDPAYSDFQSSLFSSPSGVDFVYELHQLLAKIKLVMEE